MLTLIEHKMDHKQQNPTLSYLQQNAEKQQHLIPSFKCQYLPAAFKLLTLADRRKQQIKQTSDFTETLY